LVLCAPAKRGRASGPKRRWPSHSVAHESGRPTPGFGSDVETTRRTARVGAFTARVCSASGSGRARDGLLVLCASRWRLRASCPKRRWPSHSVAHESGPSAGSRTTGFGLSALAGGKEFVIPESHPGIGADVCACMRAWAVRAVYGSLGESSRAIVGSSICGRSLSEASLDAEVLLQARRVGRFREKLLCKKWPISKGRSAVDETLFLFMRDYRHTVLNGGGGGLGDS